MIQEIKTQGGKLDTIQDNVIEVNTNLKNANTELKKTEDSAGTNNNLLKWISLFFIAILIIGFLIYLMLYKNS
jgi:t-SNARE complex subunit (syntaxin)